MKDSFLPGHSDAGAIFTQLGLYPGSGKEGKASPLTQPAEWRHLGGPSVPGLTLPPGDEGHPRVATGSSCLRADRSQSPVNPFDLTNPFFFFFHQPYNEVMVITRKIK